MDEIKNIKTDNIPLLDELIYNLKKIVLTCIIKDEERADRYETLESKKKSDIYLACLESRASLRMFKIVYEDLLAVAYPDNMMLDALKDYTTIPNNFANAILKRKCEQYINSYIEENNYYRMLNGLPNIEDPGIKIDISYLPERLYGTIDLSKRIHEMRDSEIDVLYAFDVIDRLIIENPTKRYLYYMGSRKISVYKARTMKDFDLLYVTNDAPPTLISRFIEKYELNKVYTKKVVYSEAYKLNSDYYDNFIRVLILIETIKDIIDEIQDFIIKKDIFDIRTIQLIFESNGVDFFPEIPFRYQLAMVRNINRLIKFKSTTTNIIDICSLFGFDNIEVFKFYLLKMGKKNENGRYVKYYKDVLDDDTGKIVRVEDLNANYELKFLKVPIDGNVDNFIHDNGKFVDYHEVVTSDKYWNGDLSHEYIERCILEREFNYVQSKYLSIDTIYSLTELTFQMCYFFNILFDKYKLEELLLVSVPLIDSYAKFKFTDLICYLYSLMYSYNGIVDDLMDKPEKVLIIKGFNFKANMAELAVYVKEKGFTLEELGVDGFINPENGILSYNQLIEIYLNNKKIHDHIIDQMVNANNAKIYNIYKDIYDALMIMDFSMDFFKKKDGTLATTYTDFLKDRDSILYHSLISIQSIENEKVKQSKITEVIDAAIYAIEEYINGDDFKFIFSNLPSVSSESVKRYIYKVVNFFKSYKVEIYNINTLYKLDDKLENKIKMIDDILMTRVFNKHDTIDVILKMFNTSQLTKKEKIELSENLYFQITYWIDKILYNKIDLDEKIELQSNLIFKNNLDIYDSIKITEYS